MNELEELSADIATTEYQNMDNTIERVAKHLHSLGYRKLPEKFRLYCEDDENLLGDAVYDLSHTETKDEIIKVLKIELKAQAEDCMKQARGER
jgi:hypothetical protein